MPAKRKAAKQQTEGEDGNGRSNAADTKSDKKTKSTPAVGSGGSAAANAGPKSDGTYKHTPELDEECK